MVVAPSISSMVKVLAQEFFTTVRVMAPGL